MKSFDDVSEIISKTGLTKTQTHLQECFIPGNKLILQLSSAVKLKAHYMRRFLSLFRTSLSLYLSSVSRSPSLNISSFSVFYFPILAAEPNLFCSLIRVNRILYIFWLYSLYYLILWQQIVGALWSCQSRGRAAVMGLSGLKPIIMSHSNVSHHPILWWGRRW